VSDPRGPRNEAIEDTVVLTCTVAATLWFFPYAGLISYPLYVLLLALLAAVTYNVSLRWRNTR
jgi:hypothetical protein